jgi:hypothetical protein
MRLLCALFLASLQLVHGQQAACTDRTQNGDERGVDCGGSCPACPPPAPVPAPAGGVPGPTLGWQEGECQGAKIGSRQPTTADKASCLAYCRSVPKVGCCRSEAGRAGKTAPFDCFAHNGTSFKSAKAGADPDWSYVISTVATPPPPSKRTSCTDRTQNGDERGVDCGGSCPACPPPAPVPAPAGGVPGPTLGWQEGECQGAKIGSRQPTTADKASCLAYCRSVPKVGCCRSEAGRTGKTAPFDCFAHTGTSFKSAKAGADPDWSYVISTVATPPPPSKRTSCTDRTQNGDERGVDCGGSCPACPPPAPVPAPAGGVYVISTVATPPPPSPRKTTVTPPPAPAKSVIASVKLSTDITTIPAGSSASHNDLFCHSIFLSLNCKCSTTNTILLCSGPHGFRRQFCYRYSQGSR